MSSGRSGAPWVGATVKEDLGGTASGNIKHVE